MGVNMSSLKIIKDMLRRVNYEYTVIYRHTKSKTKTSEHP